MEPYRHEIFKMIYITFKNDLIMDKQALKQYIDNLISRGSSAAELARRCGVSDTSMSLFRTGKYSASDDILAEKLQPDSISSRTRATWWTRSPPTVR